MASVFTHLTLRFTLLRVLCCSTTLQLIEMLDRMKPYFENIHKLRAYYINIAILCLVLLHHGASTFGPRFSLPGLLDLLLVFVEIGLCLPPHKIYSWYPREIVLYLALLCTTWFTLVLIALLRIGEAIQRRRRYLRARYDITGARWAYRSESENLHAGVEGANIQEPLKAYHVLFGMTLWKVHFLGESRVMVVFRGVLGALLLVAIPIFSVFVLVIDPVFETGLTPFKGMKSHGLPMDFLPTNPPVWNVIFTRTKYWVEGGDNNPDFSAAISVTPLWNSNGSNPPCTYEALPPSHSESDLFAYDGLLFHCPARVESAFRHFAPDDDQHIRPDLLVAVNFTMMNISSNSIIDGAINSVQIMLGLTNSTSLVFQATPSTTLLPGMNVVGISRLSIRRMFKQPALAALGVMISYETFLISEIVDVLPDPQAGISGLIPRSPDIATIRIISRTQSPEVTVIEDSREKSITKGFATLGGLWTFLAGIFTALFGSSIMRILFGSKPISAFGLTRSFKGDSIREAYLQAYPRLTTDLKTEPGSRGLVSFISDHLVDFSFLAKEKEGGDSDSDPDAGLDEEKQRTTNVTQETATPLPQRSDLQTDSSSSPRYAPDIGLEIWGLDPNGGRSEGNRG